MKPRTKACLSLMLSAAAGVPISSAPTAAPTPVVVTTSLIECAVTDATCTCPGCFQVVRLIAPGSCPGHFDISPRRLPELRRARLIVRHDFQQVLDDKLRRLGAEGLQSIPLTSRGSLLIPANYAALTHGVANALARLRPELAPKLAEAAAEQHRTAETVGQSIRKRATPWARTPVIASVHQQGFCEWLGLRVVGVMPRTEDMTPRVLASLTHVDARFVVANLQSGRGAAISLAKRMGIPAAVLSNFPGADGYGESYRDLQEANLRELDTAWRKSRSSN